MSPDITVENEGTIFLFHLHTPLARLWIEESVEENAQFFGIALVVEHRYARDLAVRAAAAGLVVA